MAKKVNNDTLILGLKAQIEEKKKLIKKSEKFTPITNCSLLLNGTRYNLNVVGKEEILFLTATLGSLKLGLNSEFTEESLEISGFSVDSWLTDLKSKYNTLNRRLEEERLKKLEDKLHNLLSTDKKVELEINDIMKQI